MLPGILRSCCVLRGIYLFDTATVARVDMIFTCDLHHSRCESCVVVSNLAAMHPPAVLKTKCAPTGFPEFRVPIYAAMSAAGHAEEMVAHHDQAEA